VSVPIQFSFQCHSSAEFRLHELKLKCSRSFLLFYFFIGGAFKGGRGGEAPWMPLA